MGQRGFNANPVKKRRWVNPVQRVAKMGRPIVQPWDAKGLSRAERVKVFLETLPITSGMLNTVGATFKVRDWQWKEIIEPIYAVNGDGRRAVRESFISMPRKNGKSGLVAGLCLCHLCGPEAVERGEMVSAAAEQKQAAIIFKEMEAVIERVPWMRNRILVKQFTKELIDMETGTEYAAISARYNTKHGQKISFWIYDELAQAKDQELYDVLSTSGGSWDEPLGIVISTQSGDPRHIMSRLYDDGEQAKRGIGVDPARHVCIYSAPIEADPWSEKTWYACNPALNDFRSLEELRDFARKAKRMPAFEAPFRLLYLNQRVSTDTRLIPGPIWNACGETADEFDRESLKGRVCYAALDLSGSGQNDLTALVLLFPMDGQLKALPLFWASEDGLLEAEHRDRVPYRLWANQGHLLTTPGAVLDYGFIAKELATLSQLYQIQVLAVDPWAYKGMVQKLEMENVGTNLVIKEHGQGIRDMSPAVTALENAALSGKLRHNRNPILTWNNDNVKVTHDSSGNRKCDKRKSTGRIDGIVALSMACNLAASYAQEEASYEVTLI